MGVRVQEVGQLRLTQLGHNTHNYCFGWKCYFIAVVLELVTFLP